MIKIFTTDTVKELDQYTILNEPITPIDLVERAATLFMHEFCRHYSKQSRIVIFAGYGNNGADALAIARLLIDESYKIETYLFNPPTKDLSPECEINKQRLLEMEKIQFTEVIDELTPPDLSEHDIVIDGLFGSGLSRPLEGGFAAIVNYINESGATVVSIDIPSGLLGEENQGNDTNAIIKADYTLSFGFPKIAFFLAENAHYVGEWKVLDIGIHPDIVEETPTPFAVINDEDVAELFVPRSRFAHKGVFGHALLIAGSRGKMGAALLAARSCLRSGAGLLTAHIPLMGEQTFQTALPEAMLSFDPYKDYFTTTIDTASFAAIGIGPGLGKHIETKAAFERLLESNQKPMVIDADGINLLAENQYLLDKLPAQCILTPHPKEFDRLAGPSNSSYERLTKALNFAVDHKVCLVLKGAYTATCTPAGKVYFNTSGNPGMATAGSGDVLTGIILGLLANGYETEVAAIAGVYLHGLAGDLAAAYHSEESMIAGDITEMLGKAFKQMK